MTGAASTPNILLVLADDHGPWSIGCYGNHETQTPAMDRLAREGVRFVQALTPSPVCSPARACLLTGQTPSQTGIHDWIDESQPACRRDAWLNGRLTLFRLLANAGYHCGLSGKWHVGHSDRNPDGAAFCFGMPRGQGVQDGLHDFHLNGQPLQLTGRKSDLITEHALRFFDEAPTDRPFFLNVGYTATHSDYHTRSQRPDLVARYDDAEFMDIPEPPPHPWRKNEGFPEHELCDPAQHRARKQGYYAAVTETDEHLGRLLSHLEARGQLGRTLVVYTSDHGCALGHQGFWGKGNSTRPLNMYEVSLRVPLLVCHPGGPVAAGKTVESAVDHYDTFATLCDIAGVDVGDGNVSATGRYPGRSYRHLLARDVVDADWGQVKFGEYGDLRMIRTPEWKYVRRYPDGPDDLFHLTDDPEEQINLAGSAAHANRQSALANQLERWYARHEDPHFSGLNVRSLPPHNLGAEAWRDGIREAR